MIRVVHPGSRILMLTFSHPGSRIQGSKRYPIPDPGSGSATLLEMMKQEKQHGAIPKMGHTSGSEYFMKNQYYETKAEDKDDQLRTVLRIRIRD
jgi:hypothetical protein